jgi:hypothetical protein
MRSGFAALLVLAFAGCGPVQTKQVLAANYKLGEKMEAAIGSPMVNYADTTEKVRAGSGKKPRVDGVRAELVYLGFLGSDPLGKNTIRVRYLEYSVTKGIETPILGSSAEVNYDLSQSKEIGYKGWRVQVLDATNTTITYMVVASPPVQ